MLFKVKERKENDQTKNRHLCSCVISIHFFFSSKTKALIKSFSFKQKPNKNCQKAKQKEAKIKDKRCPCFLLGTQELTREAGGGELIVAIVLCCHLRLA